MDRPVAYSDYILRDWIPAVAETPLRNAQTLAEALALRNPFKVIEEARASAIGQPGANARKALRALIVEAVQRRAAA